MTYTVFSGTLNPTHSLTLGLLPDKAYCFAHLGRINVLHRAYICCHQGAYSDSVNKYNTRKPRKGADGHRCQHAWLVASYVQSQSQGCSLGQRGDFRNFRRSLTLTLTLTLDRVNVTPTYTVHVGLHASPTT